MHDLADHLATGRIDTVNALFAANGSRPPTVIWQPSESDLEQPLLRQFARRCNALEQDRMGTISRTAFEELDLSHLSSWLMEIDALNGGADFRYRSYGQDIQAIYGHDMTGRTTSEFGGHISTFFASLYLAALRRRQSVLSVHEPPASVFARLWRRLIIPLAEPDGRISGFAVLNVADNELHPGLEAIPDPVFVLNENGQVLFANSAAQELFGPRSFTRHPVLLEEYSGLDIPLSETSTRPRPQHLRRVVLLDGSATQFALTARSLRYRDRICHVVVAKQS